MLPALSGDRILLVLTSLRAEGTPRLAHDLIRNWRRMGCETDVVVLFAQPRDLRPAFDALNIRIDTLSWPERGWKRYLALTRHIRRCASQRRYMGIVCMPLGWHFFVAVAGWTKGLKTIAHAGNAPEPSCSRQWLLFLLLVQAARPFTTRIAACSDYVRSSVVDAFRLSHQEVVTIANGTSILTPSVRPTNPSAGEVRLVMVGTLEQHKDQATLLRALKILDAGERRHRLRLIGDGSLRAELERLTAELSLGSSVEFLGSRNDVAELLANADLFVFSTTEREGQGIALIEAMTSGVPVVASDVGACREVLAGGECGLLARPGDVSALADAISRALDEPLATERRRRLALERAIRLYGSADAAAAYLSLLK